MYLLHSWKEAFKFFAPAQLKIFFLAYLKTVMSTYKTYFRYGWPFILVATIAWPLFFFYVQWAVFDMPLQIYYGDISYEFIESFFYERRFLFAVGSFIFFVFAVASVYCSFLVAISARVSVDKKNCSYFRNYTKRFFIGYLVLLALLALVELLLTVHFVKNGTKVGDAWDWSLGSTYSHLTRVDFLQYMIWALWRYVVSVFAVLFFLDFGRTKSLLADIWYGIKMTFYNLPIFVVPVIVIFSTVYVLHDYTEVFGFLRPIFEPIYFCFFSVFYTKKVYNQARLYQGI